jgi:hypothetical protein
MNEIVRRTDYGSQSPVRIDRSTMKAMEALRGVALVREAQEYVAARTYEQRLDGAEELAGRAVHHLTRLHQQITDVSRDDPGLEMQLRQIQQVVATQSGNIMYRYMSRPL